MLKIFKSYFSQIIIGFFLFGQANASFDIKASTAILQDYLSGEIIYEKDPDQQIYPASMTKIMTSIIVFDLIKKGDLSLDDKFMVSENAWRLSKSGYSSMFIMVGDEVSVENLLKGIIIASGNDACVALAEGVAGSEEEFAIMMNSKAKEIGMTNTNFTNSSGIDHINNYSTVKDIMLMSNYLIKNYPENYKLFKEKKFTWDRTGGDPITQGNRNPLLYKNNLGADGIKTGHLAISKYSLAASILKKNRRLIGVGSGFNTKSDRSKEFTKLFIWGLTNFDVVEVVKKDSEFIELDVWLGKKDTVKAYVKNNVYKTIRKGKKKYLKATVNYKGPIHAPIKKDDILGKLTISYKDEIIEKHDLLAFEDIKKLNIFSRLIKSINFLIWGDV